MRVVVDRVAHESAEMRSAWWHENRREAPDMFDGEYAAALALLAYDAKTWPVHRRWKGVEVRMFVLRGSRTTIYYTIEDDVVRVLDVWGSVRRKHPRFG